MKKSTKSSTAGEAGYDVIRQAIIDGEYREGDRLIEAELAERAGVSRTPIRDALRRLEREGFVHIRAGSGAVVAKYSGSDLTDLFEIRAALETLGAGLAALHARAKDLDELEAMCDAMDKIAAGRGTDFLEAFSVQNTAFHLKILEMSRNPQLAEMAGSLMKLGVIMRTYNRFDITRLERSIYDHRCILAALRAGSVSRAESAMRSHVLSSIDTFDATSDAPLSREK
ncbi:GntR family transcriptional regulator [Salipiger pacificus]|nr:GntR family transcriptional regulator [Alloyangia pacifica]